MPFWKKKKEDKIIQCSSCEWSPDGDKHWSCSCGHLWNTFTTKGKCPNCGTQWKDTWCPACGKTTAHKDWYKTKAEIEQLENTGDKILRAKKKSLESKLIDYGIKNHRVSYLPYLDHTKENFHSSYEAGCRMMILYAIGLSVQHLEERKNIIQWFKDEKIWDRVSPDEKTYLKNPNPSEDMLMDLSWRLEGALSLGWCLQQIDTLPRLDDDDDHTAIQQFQENIPQVGETLHPFLSTIKLRDLGEIYEENLLNELATTYFRNLMFNGKEDQTQINRHTSFERHKTLNWLRQFMGIEDWDDTDTST